MDTCLAGVSFSESSEYSSGLLKSTVSKEAEGMGTDWQSGQDPPAKVRQWWGEEDHDVFRMYVNQNLPKELMDIVRARYDHFRKNAIM